ncbi:hypothetical protein [Legionella maceachernii]|uniref:Uncharacterized protein n=1 Tax=Legionella maceachernii TaxID=466 RepID=A0A0W0WBB4_9GAMM|nr:hypothetical protein [Legionella maceachernii]KTD29658.1 hypothetical protein Lmac_0833 [Legionella maceachernii]SKA20883.1 hypothetical protein SAMN02745128_02576 [Legionella maceachernii]SUP02632.1 Uncharacterised protein [Legionella maceachernii]
MTLDELNGRKAELENSIAQTTNQVFILHGAKNEIDYQIQLQKEKIAKEDADNLANSEQPPVQ